MERLNYLLTISSFSSETGMFQSAFKLKTILPPHASRRSLQSGFGANAAWPRKRGNVSGSY